MKYQKIDQNFAIDGSIENDEYLATIKQEFSSLLYLGTDSPSDLWYVESILYMCHRNMNIT